MSIPHDDFLDPHLQAYFESMRDTPAMALYKRWKAGETIKVCAVGQQGNLLAKADPLTFEIRPERFFDVGPVIGATILWNGEPAEGATKMLMSNSQFLEWMVRLEAVEE